MDWTSIKALTIGEPYDAEVEYLESNGTQTLTVPNLYPNTLDIQVTGGANQTILGTGNATRYRKFFTSAGGFYTVAGNSSGDDAFDIPGSTRVTVKVSIPKSMAATINVTIDGVTKTGRTNRIQSVSTLGLFGNATFGLGAMRLYGLDNYKLVRVGTAGALYDEATGSLIYPSTGVLACGPDTRVINKQVVTKIETSGFPWVPGARRVEYIENLDGNGDISDAVLNTGVAGSLDLKIEVKLGADAYAISPVYMGCLNSGSTGTKGSFQLSSLTSSDIVKYRTQVYATRAVTRNQSIEIAASNFGYSHPYTVTMDAPGDKFLVDGVESSFQLISQSYTGDLPYNFSFFRTNQNGVYSSSYIRQRLHYAKIWKSGTLVRDFVPISVNGVGYLYDFVSGTTFGSDSNTPFAIGPEYPATVLWKKPLPYDSEVEYLESDGGQWIDTGIIPAASTFGFEGSFSVNSLATTQGVFGCRNQDASAGNFSYNAFIHNGGLRCDTIGGSSWNYALTAGTLVNYVYTPTTTTVNGTTQNNGTKVDCNYSFYLFNFHIPSGAYGSGCAQKLYSWKIYVGNQLVRDFIPVRQNGVGYLFDRISWKLFGNDGTGSFGYGADVPDSW